MDLPHSNHLDSLLINIEFRETPIKVVIIKNEIDTQNILKSGEAQYDASLSQRYKLDIYTFEGEKILAIVKKPNQFAYILANKEDWHFVRTRVGIFKQKQDATPFYNVKYRTKEEIENILSKYKGEEIKDCSNEYEKLFELNNGKYFWCEYVSIGDFRQYSGILYNSSSDIDKLQLREHLRYENSD